MVASGLIGVPSASATDGSWTKTGAGVGSWSVAANWANTTIADGTGATAWINSNITVNRTVTLDSSRTLGILNIGDPDGSNQFNIAPSGTATLTFDNTGTTSAQLNFISTGTSNTVSVPIVLADSLNISNSTAYTQTISGSITGSASGTQTITNLGSGAGGVLISGNISDGAGGKVAVTQNSSTSALTLNGSNSFTGGLTLSQGVLITHTNQPAAFGAGNLNLNGGELRLEGTGAAASTRLFNNNTTVGGNTAITLDSAQGTPTSATYTFGTLNIGANTLTVQAGAAVTGTSAAMGLKFGATTMTGASTFTVNNGTVATTLLTLASLDNGGNLATFNGTGNTTVTGAVIGAGGLTKSGAGTLTLSSSNSFIGGFTLGAGTVLVANANALGDNANAVAINGGTLASSDATAYTLAQNTTIGGNFTLGQTSGGTGALTLSGTMDLGSATRTITVDNATDTINGAIIGTGGLIKSGTGMLLLQAGVNTFNGGLTLNAGILRVGGIQTTSLGAGTLTLNGGELQLASTAAKSYGRNTTVGGNIAITSDKSASGTGVNYTFGTLGIGTQTLTIQGGANATSGTAGVTFGAATMTGASTFTANNNGLGATTSLTLASLDNGGNLATFNGSGNSTVTGAIIGAGGLTKSGTGTLTLSGSNSYLGGTTINAGILVASNAASLGDSSGGLTFGGDSTLQLGASFDTARNYAINTGVTATIDTGAFNQTNSGTISGLGNLVKLGSGTLTLSATNTYTGTLSINAGTISVASTSSNLGGAGAINIGATTSAGALVYTGTSNQTLSRNINLAGTTGGATITNNSTNGSTLTLSGSIGSTGAGSKTLTLTGTSGGASTVSGIISDYDATNTTAVVIGNGTWNLSGSNTFSGGVTVNSGATVRAANDSGYGTGVLTLNGGAWNPSGNHTLANNVVIAAASTGNNLHQTTEFTGQFSGAGNWTVNGFIDGVMKLSGDNSAWTGSYKISGSSKLQLNNAHALGSGTTFTFSDAAAGMGVLESLVAVNLSQNFVLGSTGASTLFPTFTTTADMTITGTISGPSGIGLIKNGSGTLTLGSAGTPVTQTYSGLTTVSAGTLIINGTVGSGGITVNSGAILKGNLTAGGTTTIQAGATLAVGNSPGTGTFTALNLSGTTEVQFDAGATSAGRGTSFDGINVTGSNSLTYGGTLKLVFAGTPSAGTFHIFDFLGTTSGSFTTVTLFGNSTSTNLTVSSGIWTGSFDLGYGGGIQDFSFNQNAGDLSVIPEPSTWALAGIGLGFTLLRLRLRRRCNG